MADDSDLLDYDIMMKSQNIKEAEKLKKEDGDEGHDNEKSEIPKKSIRDTLYGGINVSVKTMDIVITVLIVALIASIFLGLII